jgi:hypothetical protein
MYPRGKSVSKLITARKMPWSPLVCVLSAARRRHLRRKVLLFLLFLVLPPFAYAQEATIVGTVTDPSGRIVPGASIIVTNAQTGAVRTLLTNDAGQYVAPDLPIGKYNLRLESSGFQVEESKGIELNVNGRMRVDVQLKIGTKAEVVVVELNGVAPQADSGEQSSLVSGKQISELSTNGRSIYTYIILTPGAANLMPDFQPPTPINANAGASFNGNRPSHNLFLLDGGENSDRGGGGGSSIMPSMDAIAETQNLTSNYSADYGLSSGATFSSALKSGTREFQFSLWEFFRNDALDARNYFNAAPAPVAELRYNLFGFNVGGPVTFGKLYNATRTKTFFFYNMEWRKLIQGQTLNQTVPLPSTYGGDFSAAGLDLVQLHAPAACQVSAAVKAQFAAARQALSGCTSGAPDGAKEVPFTNNEIPLSLLNANAQALLTAGGKFGGIFPAPTTGNTFIGGNNLPTNVREEIVRIDEHVNDKLTIFGHLVAEQISQDYGTTLFAADNVPSIGSALNSPSYATVVHATYAVSSNFVNSTSFSYNGNRIAILPLGLVSAPSDFEFKRFFTGPNTDGRIPLIALFGSTGSIYSSGVTPWHNSANDYQLRDDLSWIKGSHQFNFGGSWMLYQKVQDSFQETQGGFDFNGFFTGNDFADYLLGYANSYFEDAVQGTGHWSSPSFALYFQDNYRVNRRLTLNLGLRWDGIPHTYEANHQMSNFYPNLYNPASGAILNPDNQTISPSSPGLGTSPVPVLAGQQFYLNGVAICGINSPRGCVDDAWLNFGPRLGFAYDLTGTGHTVLRGGYAIMYERVQGNDVYNMAGNVPFSAAVNFPNVSLSNPGTSLLTGSTIPASIPVSGLVGLTENEYAAPRSSQFSLGIQQGIGLMALSVAYVGSQNRHQSFYSETNLPPQSLLSGFVTNNTLAQTYNSTLPYRGYNSVLLAQNEATGSYNSLQLSLRGNTLNNDLTCQVGYTYSYTRDSFNAFGDGGDLSTVTNPYQGWQYDYGPSSFDIRNIFFTNFVYQVPLLRSSSNRILKTALGGWELSGIVTATSGAPLNIGLAGQSIATVVPNTANRPDVNGKMNNPHTVGQWFDTSVFSTPAPGTWGDEPANAVVGPGRDNWNISLFKNFRFGEERATNLQFRAEFFNIWNHPQWVGDTFNGGISTNYGASNFGAVTAVHDPRTFQLALKFSF